jgi:hypothetical protein
MPREQKITFGEMRDSGVFRIDILLPLQPLDQLGRRSLARCSPMWVPRKWFEENDPGRRLRVCGSEMKEAANCGGLAHLAIQRAQSRAGWLIPLLLHSGLALTFLI